MYKHRALGAAVIAATVVAAPLALQSSASFVAKITNDTNTAGSASIAMLEKNTGTSVACSSMDGVGTNIATCSTINKYGGKLDMRPGQMETVNLEFKNTGSLPTTAFTLKPQACIDAPATAANLCDKMMISVASGGTKIVDNQPASALAGQTYNIQALLGDSPIAANGVVPITVTTTLSADAGNEYMNHQISQPLEWSFTA